MSTMNSALVMVALSVSIWQMSAAVSVEVVARSASRPTTSSMVAGALSRWASMRQCLFTEDAKEFFAAILLKDDPSIDPGKLERAIESYFDLLTLEYFGQLRENCVIDAELLRAAYLHPGLRFSTAAYAGPRTGYLTVDGKKKGAAIYLNGRLKGYITTTFAVSPGKYRVQTMKCDDMVTMVADDRKRTYCRKE